MNELKRGATVASTKSPLAARFVVPLRVLLAAMSMAGLLGWAYITLFVLAYYGRGVLVSPAAVMLLFGYVYLLLSLFPCFKNPSIKTLTIMGVALNLPLGAYF